MDQKPADFYRKAIWDYAKVSILDQSPVSGELFSKAYGDKEAVILAMCRIFDIQVETHMQWVKSLMVADVTKLVESTIKIAYHNYNLQTQKGER
jgi:hypothetical protein